MIQAIQVLRFHLLELEKVCFYLYFINSVRVSRAVAAFADTVYITRLLWPSIYQSSLHGGAHPGR